MSFRNLAIAAIAIASLSACSGNNKSQTFAPGAAQEGTSSEVGAFEAKGTDTYSFSVDQGQIMIDNSNVDAIDEAALEGYPTLMSHSKAIGSLDKAVETNAEELKLFAGDTLVMALDTREGAQRILWSKDASFNDESARVTYTRAEAGQDQTPLNGEVTFVLNECRVAQEEKQQDQGKVEEKEQDQGKVEEKQQEQGKLAGFMGSEEQGQEKEQGQEQDQGKVEEKGSPAPECKAVSIKLNLRQIVEEKKQEQEQGKVEEKQQEQDQGKVEEKKEEQKQQDQAKEEDKSQEQEQAQGQEKR